VLQPIEIYRSVPLFFGLGNLLLYLGEDEVVWSAAEVWKSVVTSRAFDDSGSLNPCLSSRSFSAGRGVWQAMISIRGAFRCGRR